MTRILCETGISADTNNRFQAGKEIWEIVRPPASCVDRSSFLKSRGAGGGSCRSIGGQRGNPKPRQAPLAGMHGRAVTPTDTWMGYYSPRA